MNANNLTVYGTKTWKLLSKFNPAVEGPFQQTPFLVYPTSHPAFSLGSFVASPSPQQILHDWRSETALCDPSGSSRALGTQEF